MQISKCEIYKNGGVELCLLKVIDSGVFIVLADITNSANKEKRTRHAFVYNSHYINSFEPTVHGAIIDNREGTCLLGIEESDRESSEKIRGMVSNFFQGETSINNIILCNPHDSTYNDSTITFILDKVHIYDDVLKKRKHGA